MAEKSVLIPPDCVIGGERSEVCRFQLDHSVFICGLGHADGAKAIQLSGRSIDSTDLINKLKLILPSSQINEIKIVGPKALCERIEHLVQSLRFTNIKIFAKETPTTLYFYPRLGRVRVEAEHLQSQNTKKIRVLIVDDSKTIRNLLINILSRDRDIEVVGHSGHPPEVEGLILKLKPDVVTMDIHMPEIDGCTLVKNIMARKPVPIVMISAISMAEGPAVLTALEYGAVDYIQKPGIHDLDAAVPIILEKIKGAAHANLEGLNRNRDRAVAISAFAGSMDANSIIAIGSSTGGPEALRTLLSGLPKEIPPILIVQHIPPAFSMTLADRLNSIFPFEVKEASDRDKVIPGRVLIAPGGKQMRFENGDPGYVRVTDEERVNLHRPSVDVLFDSLAKNCRKRIFGVLLTGMGADGAQGLLHLKQSGALTVAQDQKSCVVFGMPREAIEIGAADSVLDIGKIAEHLIRASSDKRSA